MTAQPNPIAFFFCLTTAAAPAFMVALLPLIAPLPAAPASFRERWAPVTTMPLMLDLGPCSGACGMQWDYKSWGRGLA